MSTTNLPSAVLFDMDGTLIDSEHLWLRAETRVMARHGVAWTTADQLACLGGPLERVGAYMSAMIGARHLAEQLQMELLAEMEALLLNEPVTWQAGARDVLLDAVTQRLPTALVTASWRILIDAVHTVISNDLELDPFTVIVSGDEIANPKPHPDPYLAAAAALAVTAPDCLALEDSPTGVRSAASAGCWVVAVPQLLEVPTGANVRVIPSLQGHTVSSLWQLHDR